MRLLPPYALRHLSPRAPILCCLLALTGCGYHTAGSATHIPANVRTLAVPVFATHAQAYHTEMALTQAVVRELNTRTRLPHPQLRRRRRRRPSWHRSHPDQDPSYLRLHQRRNLQLPRHHHGQGRAHRPRRPSPLPERRLLLPRAVPVHPGPQQLYPRGPRRRHSPLARLRASPRRRYAGVVLMPDNPPIVNLANRHPRSNPSPPPIVSSPKSPRPPPSAPATSSSATKPFSTSVAARESSPPSPRPTPATSPSTTSTSPTHPSSTSSTARRRRR